MLVCLPFLFSICSFAKAGQNNYECRYDQIAYDNFTYESANFLDNDPSVESCKMTFMSHGIGSMDMSINCASMCAGDKLIIYSDEEIIYEEEKCADATYRKVYDIQTDRPVTALNYVNSNDEQTEAVCQFQYDYDITYQTPPSYYVMENPHGVALFSNSEQTQIHSFIVHDNDTMFFFIKDDSNIQNVVCYTTNYTKEDIYSHTVVPTDNSDRRIFNALDYNMNGTGNAFMARDSKNYVLNIIPLSHGKLEIFIFSFKHLQQHNGMNGDFDMHLKSVDDTHIAVAAVVQVDDDLTPFTAFDFNTNYIGSDSNVELYTFNGCADTGFLKRAEYKDSWGDESRNYYHFEFTEARCITFVLMPKQVGIKCDADVHISYACDNKDEHNYIFIACVVVGSALILATVLTYLCMFYSFPKCTKFAIVDDTARAQNTTLLEDSVSVLNVR